MSDQTASTPADLHPVPLTIRFSATHDGRFQHDLETWEEKKNDILQLYTVEGLPLKDVIRIMRGRGFSGR